MIMRLHFQLSISRAAQTAYDIFFFFFQIEDNPFLFIMDCSEKKTIGCGRSSFFPKVYHICVPSWYRVVLVNTLQH